jgi:lysophospholipase L1-like esterase
MMLMTGAAMAQDSNTKLKNEDRIVFLGDSITQAGANPGGYVTLFNEAVQKKMPDASIEVIGAGISGNKVPDLQKRLQQDVIDKKPTLVVIYIGINDVWHSESGKGTPKEKYREGLIDVIQRIRHSGAGVVLCTPSVIGEKTDATNKLDGMLDEFSQISRDVAKQNNVDLLDLRKIFVSYLKSHNPDNKDRGVLTTDGVHLNAEGNHFVAQQILKHVGMNQEHNTGGKSLRHIVLFKFKADLNADQVTQAVAEFAKLKDKIDSVVDIEYGENISVENLSQGFTHCFTVTFQDVASRDAYLTHPAHTQFVEFLEGKLDQVLVVDYWTQK